VVNRPLKCSDQLTARLIYQPVRGVGVTPRSSLMVPPGSRRGSPIAQPPTCAKPRQRAAPSCRLRSFTGGRGEGYDAKAQDARHDHAWAATAIPFAGVGCITIQYRVGKVPIRRPRTWFTRQDQVAVPDVLLI